MFYKNYKSYLRYFFFKIQIFNGSVLQKDFLTSLIEEQDFLSVLSSRVLFFLKVYSQKWEDFSHSKEIVYYCMTIF